MNNIQSRRNTGCTWFAIRFTPFLNLYPSQWSWVLQERFIQAISISSHFGKDLVTNTPWRAKRSMKLAYKPPTSSDFEPFPLYATDNAYDTIAEYICFHKLVVYFYNQLIYPPPLTKSTTLNFYASSFVLVFTTEKCASTDCQALPDSIICLAGYILGCLGVHQQGNDQTVKT